MKHLYLSTRFSDITIIASGERLPAHRCVISQNEYFDALFRSNMKDSQNAIIEVDLSVEHAKMMLALIYGCEIPDIHDLEDDVDIDVTKAKHILGFMRNTREYMMQKYFFDPNNDCYCVLLPLITWQSKQAFLNHLTIDELESIFELWAESMCVHGIDGCTIYNVRYINRYIELVTQPDTINTISESMIKMVLDISPIDTHPCCITRLVLLWLKHNNEASSGGLMNVLAEKLKQIRDSTVSQAVHSECNSCKMFSSASQSCLPHPTPHSTHEEIKFDVLSMSLLDADEIELLNDHGNDLGGDD